MSASSQPTIHYTLGMSKPSTHLLEVEVIFENLPVGHQALDVQLPVWRPGRYMVLDFASGVQEFSVHDENRAALQWSKVEKSVWRIQPEGARSVTVRYNIYANEFNLRTRGLNDEHAFVDGASVFMYVEKYRPNSISLKINPYQNWHVTTGLGREGDSFIARNYDEFVDCPIEIGSQQDFTFDIEGIPHVLSISGEGNWNADTLIRDMTKIVKVQKAFWGEFPYKRYVFLLHCAPNAGGGTEHLNSTVMGVRPFIFKNAEAYRGFLGLVSHEYFHTWNVKQLRPKGIHPYDYMKENYSEELWIAEGTTSYFGDLLLMRAGFKTVEKYLEDVAGAAQGDRQRPGNTNQSVAEASFDAWVKYWRGTEQSFNLESDYYAKGGAISMLLDLEIRQRSGDSFSLDDVMRAMYKQFPLSGSGYTLADFKGVCEEFARGSLEEFFAKYIRGTNPLPWEQSLGYAGLQLSTKDTIVKSWVGFQTTDSGEKTRITRVIAGSPAALAGLDIGDEIVALNGVRARSNDITDRINDLAVGAIVTMTIFRNDKLRNISITVGRSPVPNYKLSKWPNPTGIQKLMYQSWLNTTWMPVDPPSK